MREGRLHTRLLQVRKARRLPLRLTELFGERKSRRRVLVAFMSSLVAMIGWWAVLSWLTPHGEQLARMQRQQYPAQWGARAAPFGYDAPIRASKGHQPS